MLKLALLSQAQVESDRRLSQRGINGLNPYNGLPVYADLDCTNVAAGNNTRLVSFKV